MAKTMNVNIGKKLAILHTEASKGWGGQEIRILQEAKEFVKRGHNIVIACQPDSVLYKRSREEGIKTEAIKMSKSYNPITLHRLYELIKRESLGIVNTHSSIDSWLGSIAGKFAGAKIVRTRHIDVPISKNPLDILYKFPDRIITTSEAIKTRLIRGGFSEERIYAIPTGVNLDLFKPTKQRTGLKEDLKITGRRPVITTVAVLRSWKGHRFLLRSIRQVVKSHPNVIFLIVGDGPQKRSLEKLISELDISQWVTMTGHRTDIPDILNISDLFVLPSTKYEGVPQALLQAMATGVPVLATNVDGVKDIVKDGKTGILTEPSNTDTLSKKIVETLVNGEVTKRLASNGRRLVEDAYGLDRMVNKLLDVYNDLVFS